MNPVRHLLTISLIISLLHAAFAADTASQAYQDVPVRVSIIEGKNFVKIYVKDPYRVYAANSSKVLLKGPCIETKVISVKDGLLMRDKVFKVAGVRIKAGKESFIYVDNKPFRGAIDITRKADGKLLVVNRIGLEEYLYGVLCHEVSHKWPMEALRAQAIVARTFALYQMKQNRAQPYDLRSDVYSQVYGGSDFEQLSTTKAVDATRGKAIVYKGELLPAYYHSACSGGTESASALWKVDMPPLRGVACDFCSGSPYHRWIKDIPLWQLRQKLAAAGYKIGSIISVRVLSRNASGRVEKLEIKDVSGASVALSGKDFRQLMGPNEVRSTKFDASVRWGQLLLDGRGWGHGVGMCQWGAFGQSKAGKSAEEILRHYYPGAEIVDR